MKKSEFKKNLGRKIALALGVGMFSLLPLVQALPTGGQSDSATIKVSGSTMDISGAANNVINWQSFSIGKNETVSFDANNYLNLVNGPDVSNIYGTLKGAGNIFLVNPNGIVFGKDAVINVGSLTASTAPISSVDTEAFLNGNTTSITGSVTEGSDISMAALVNVEAANSLVLNAGEVVLQNTAVLDKVTRVTGATEVIIGADGALALTLEQISKLPVDADRATLVTDLSQITNMNGKYLLKQDITADGNFTPIGAVEEEDELSPSYGSLIDKGFSGYFNGLGYKVSGLNIDMSSSESYWGGIGLFSSIGSMDSETSSYKPGFVKNLNIENASVVGGESHVGVLTGVVKGDSLVSNVAVSGSVSGYFAAGIAGAIQDGSAKLTNVSNAAAISGVEAGGIVAAAQCADAVTIEDAKNTGRVTGKTVVGGIVGLLEEIHTAKLSNVYNTGAIKAVGTTGEYATPGTAGGIVGAVLGDGLTIKNAYNSGTVTGDTVGGIVGNFEGDNPPTVKDSYYANVTNSSGNTYGTSVSADKLQDKVDAIWGGAAATDPETPGSEPTTPTTPTDTPTTPSTEPTTPTTPTDTPTTPSSEPTTPTTPTTPTADSQSGSSSRMDVIRDILTELMGSNVSSEQRRSMERDTENNIVAATSNPGRGDRPMAATPTADIGAAAPAGDSSIVENTDKSAPTGGEVNSNNDEDEN